MTKKYVRPIPDYSAALPPKSPPLNVTPSQVLEILQKRRGRLFTASEIVLALKEDINIWDNCAAVIAAACALVERHDAEEGTADVGGYATPAWMAPKPKEPEDYRLAPVDEAPKP